MSNLKWFFFKPKLSNRKNPIAESGFNSSGKVEKKEKYRNGELKD